jgi:acyl-CoA hydrolase
VTYSGQRDRQPNKNNSTSKKDLTGNIHFSKFHLVVHTTRPIFEHLPDELSDVDRAIGKYVAGLIEDGATLQMGLAASSTPCYMNCNITNGWVFIPKCFQTGLSPWWKKE